MVSGAYVSPADTNPGSLFQHKMNHQVFRAPPKVFQIRALPKMTVTSMTRMDGRLLTEAAVEVLVFVDFSSAGGAPVAAAVGSLAAERMLVNAPRFRKIPQSHAMRFVAMLTRMNIMITFGTNENKDDHEHSAKTGELIKQHDDSAAESLLIYQASLLFAM